VKEAVKRWVFEDIPAELDLNICFSRKHQPPTRNEQSSKKKKINQID